MKRGDIVLISYPFTDLSSQIVRPALIVSTKDFHRCGGEAIFLFITKERYYTPYDFIINSSNSDFNLTGLKLSSTFRVGKIITLDRKLAKKRLGEASLRIMGEVSSRLKNLLEISS